MKSGRKEIVFVEAAFRAKCFVHIAHGEANCQRTQDDIDDT